MKYPDFSEAVKMCLEAEHFTKMGKSDMSMAFRQAPIRVCDQTILVLKAEHPETKCIYYFVDKCLPFRSSISCAIFQAISDSISHIVEWRTSTSNLNYLDDYFFIALLKTICDRQLDEFVRVCYMINFPISLEKTFWGTTILTFLGFLLDTK